MDLNQQILAALERIERQNREILASLTPNTGRKFLLSEEAAARLRRSPWTIRQLCLAKLIRAVRGEDGRWKISAEEVKRLEEEGVPKLPPHRSNPG